MPPPQDHNGIIRGYNVTYQGLGDTDDVMRELTTADMFIVITGLVPFTNYSVRVAAFTVNMGPYSQPINVQTDSDREFQ